MSLDEALKQMNKQMLPMLQTFTGQSYKSQQIFIEELFAEGIWDGNEDVYSDFDEGFKQIRIIQEDHYDQHMDEDEDKPAWEEIIFEVSGAYVFWA